MGLSFTDDLKALAVCSVFLFFKMLFVGLYTGLGRSAEGRPAAPEDTNIGNNEGYKATPEPTRMGRVERGQGMHRNDLENIPIFLILAVLLIFTSASTKNSPEAHIAFYVIFTFARLMHTICYIFSLQPWRTISWIVGVLATAALGIDLLIQVFTLPY